MTISSVSLAPAPVPWRMPINPRGALCAMVLCLLPIATVADAIMRSEAMFASTIAEIYVTEDEVRLELEIGLQDLAEGFRDLLPDDLFTRMGLGEEAYDLRLERFLSEQFLVLADGEALDGQLVSIGPSERIRRDDITGEALPVDGEPETVIGANFRWPLAGKPDQLTFEVHLPRATAVGYVAYHGAVAVNDFRYLVARQQLNLDWDDPWYSAFETRSLRRQYYAPMTGFIYVEPYEVRKEIIVRPKDVQRYVDLGLDGRDTIPVDLQPQVRERVIEFLSQHHPVTIDGEPAGEPLIRADFLERTLRTSRVIDPPEELDINGAILGVKFIYPHPDFAESVTMRWDLFDDKITTVPVSAVDPTGPLPQILEPDYDILEWENFIRIPVMPQLADVAPPPGQFTRLMFYGRWLLALAAALLGLRLLLAMRSGSARATSAAAFIVGAVLAVGAWRAGDGARLDEQAIRDVVGGLLTNVYRAFDFRAESDVYDVLAQSVDGELLREVYLEMRRGLVLASQGGASARVRDVELVELDVEPAPGNSLRARATWRLDAAVGHWGHIHTRRNEYRADLTLGPVDGVWKLTSVDILDELRL